MKKAKHQFPILFLSVVTLSVNGQEQKKDWRLYDSPASRKDTVVKIDTPVTAVAKPQTEQGNITYFQDEKISLLDSLRKENPINLNGYRVQIYFGNRNDAREMRTKFILEHPDQGAYISYLAPNFRLRVGDFRSRLECEAFKKEIAREFPGSYLVKDKIELPNLHPERDEDSTID